MEAIVLQSANSNIVPEKEPGSDFSTCKPCHLGQEFLASLFLKLA